MKRAIVLSTLYSLLSAILIGCGYTARTLLPSHIKTIYVAPFANTINITGELGDASRYYSYRHLLEIDLTNEVVDRFIYDGTLQAVNRSDADVILSGEVIEYFREPLRYSRDDEVEEYRLNLVVNVSLKDTREDKMLWEERRLTGDTTYFTTGSLAKSEDAAIDEVTKDLARRIVEQTVEGW